MALIVRVNNMESAKGNAVPNQFIIRTAEGEYFQSYQSIIAFRPYDNGKKVLIDENYWDYSVTTGKYRNIFLRESKKETERKIETGIYEMADLNY